MLTEHLSQCIYKWRDWASESMNVIPRSYDYYAPVVQWGLACRFSYFKSFILSITLQILWTLWMSDLDYSASLPIPGLSSKHTVIPSQQISLNHCFILAPGENPLSSLAQVWVGITFQITRRFFFFFLQEGKFSSIPNLCILWFSMRLSVKMNLSPGTLRSRDSDLSQKYSWRWQKWFSTARVRPKQVAKKTYSWHLPPWEISK